jgi:hypothetical protein
MTQTVPNLPPPRDPSQVQIRPTRLEDYEHLQALESSHGLLTLGREDWRAIWLDNPLRQRLGDDFPFGWVLEETGGRIVGQLTNIPTLYTLAGQELVAVTGRAWVVAPEYRGVALWLMDEYFNQSNADLFINTTVNALAVDAFTTFGSARVPLGNWEQAAYWITNYAGFAKTALRLKGVAMPGVLCFPAGAALRVKDMLRSKNLSARSSNATIECAASFDSRFDAFWENMKRENVGKLLCQRDSQTLTWHFAGPMRTGNLWIFTATSQNRLRAYCIFKRQDHPQSGLVRMRLVDYQNLEGEHAHLPALLSAALQRCKVERIHSLEHVGCRLPKTALVDEYAPYRRQLPAWPFYYCASDAALNQKLADPVVWDPSSYDGDASL